MLFFNKSVVYATERHKDRVSNVMKDLDAELQPTLKLAEARMRQSGDLVKLTSERLMEQAPETIPHCLQDGKRRIERALEGSTTFLKSCTNELNRDEMEIMSAYDQEASKHKKRVFGVLETVSYTHLDVYKRQTLHG